MKCEHCGHEQASGRTCDACGMMLGRVRRRGTQAAPAGPPGELRCQCGHVQASGRFCDACGMMLDAFRAQPDADDGAGRCRQCGGWTSKPVCPNCGIPMPGAVGEA